MLKTLTTRVYIPMHPGIPYQCQERLAEVTTGKLYNLAGTEVEPEDRPYRKGDTLHFWKHVADVARRYGLDSLVLPQSEIDFLLKDAEMSWIPIADDGAMLINGLRLLAPDKSPVIHPARAA